MFKIYTVTAAKFETYEENVICSSMFSNPAAAENAFRNLAEKYNVEISDDDVANGFVSRVWENDDDGPDSALEIKVCSEEVYESYAEEEQYRAQAFADFKKELADLRATSTNMN